MSEKAVPCPCGGSPPTYRPLAQIDKGRCYCVHCGEIYENGKPTGKKVASMSEEQRQESGVFKALKLAAKVDWKSMLLILTAGTGALGFVWNKIELYVQQYQQRQTQQQVNNTDAAAGGAYEAIATRLDELFLKVEVLESKMNVKVDYVPVEAVPEPDPPSSFGAGGGATEPVAVAADEPEAPEPEAPPVEPEPKPEPVSKRFKSARLPEFEAVQQAARESRDLEQFIQQVKAK